MGIPCDLKPVVSPAAKQNERRPEERVTLFLDEIDLSLSQGGGRAVASYQAGIECVHETSGLLVIDWPQGDKQRGRARRKEASSQSNQLVARSHSAHSGLASAQSNQITVELQLIRIADR